jgi:hypothetical protein
MVKQGMHVPEAILVDRDLDPLLLPEHGYAHHDARLHAHGGLLTNHELEGSALERERKRTAHNLELGRSHQSRAET